MNVYIACGLTHVPSQSFDEYVLFIHALAKGLSSSAAQCRVKYALVNSDPQLANKPASEKPKLCYLWDREMVEESDVLVAEASFPSTGLGIELQLAESKGIPIVMCFRDFGTNKAKPTHYINPDHSSHELQVGDGFITLMALGVPTVFKVIQYGTIDDGVSKVVDAINVLARK